MNTADASRDDTAGRGPRAPALLLVIFGIALLLRLLHLWEMWEGPFSPAFYLPIDATLYHRWAIEWLHGTWPPHEAFFRPPLYTLFVGSIYGLVGPGPVSVLVVQAALGAASCVLVHGIARELFADPRVALLAALACAVSGPLVYFDAQLLSGTLDVLLQLLALRLLLLAGHRPGLGAWLAAGAVLGLSAINRGAILLFVPVVMVWLALQAAGLLSAPRASHPLRFATARAGAVLLSIGLVVLPVAWHNVRYDEPGPAAGFQESLRRAASGRFVAVASNGGVNFYLGNHGALRGLNRLDHPDHVAEYERILGEPLQHGLTAASATNGYLVQQTLGHIAAWPRDWLPLMGWKLAELLNGAEMPRNTSPYADRTDTWLMRLLLWRSIVAFPTGIILPLAMLGIFLSRGDWRRQLLAWGSLGTQAAFILAFFVTSRYRLPMWPLLAVYAAHACLILFDGLRQGRQQSALRLASATALLVLVCNLPIVAVSATHHWVDHYNLGVAFLKRHEFERAETNLRRAVELNPGGARALLALCGHLVDRDRSEEALPFCRRAVQAAPGDASAQYRLGAAFEATGSLARSLNHYRRAAQLAPDSTDAFRAVQRVAEERRVRKQRRDAATPE